MTYKDLNIEQKKQFYNLLTDIISVNRKELIEKIVKQRTSWFVPVIENIHKAQNASAVLRTCDCLGLQEVSIIENNNTFLVNDEISLGANKWLNITKYKNYQDNTIQCFNDLRAKGYKIVATMPYQNDINLQELDINTKCAIVFGSEVDGISQIAKDNSDMFMKIPMYGFTESMNISVSAAIVLHYLTNKLRQSNLPWALSENEQYDTMIHWALESITSGKKIEKQLIQRFEKK